MNPGGAIADAAPLPTQPAAIGRNGLDGATMFARYAYPPNELGYCGPDDHAALLQYAAAGVVDPGLGQLARGFAGAWPYLELIAGSTHIGHPLDRRVVEAYWLGSSLLERIDMHDFGNSLFERFRSRAGAGWSSLAEAIPVGALPTHSFHVFGVYPWVGLLRGERSEQPLHVLERCRIRWGKVLTVDGDQAVVASQPLTWDGTRLALGEYRPETVTRGLDGRGLAAEIAPGDWVSMHWGWVCERLSRRQLSNLRRYSLLELDVTNRRVSRPGAAVVLS
ncbi:MAG TPA: DUF6390 family protein [Candidatus Limnocylindria bacterium]